MTSFAKAQIKLFIVAIIMTQKEDSKTWDKIEKAITTNMSAGPTLAATLWVENTDG